MSWNSSHYTPILKGVDMTEPRKCFGNGLVNPFFNTKKYTICQDLLRIVDDVRTEIVQYRGSIYIPDLGEMMVLR